MTPSVFCFFFPVGQDGDPDCTLLQYWARLEVSAKAFMDFFSKMFSFVLGCFLWPIQNLPVSNPRLDSLNFWCFVSDCHFSSGKVLQEHGEGSWVVEWRHEGWVREPGAEMARLLRPGEVCSNSTFITARVAKGAKVLFSQVFVWSRAGGGGLWHAGGCDRQIPPQIFRQTTPPPPPPPTPGRQKVREYGQCACGTHPTGMHTCWMSFSRINLLTSLAWIRSSCCTLQVVWWSQTLPQDPPEGAQLGCWLARVHLRRLH